MTWVGSPGDVDRDGRTDLLAVNTAGLLYLYRGSGGPIAPAGRQRVGRHHGDRHDPDFDGNQTQDLVARYADGRLGQYSIATTGVISRVRVFGNSWQGMRALLGCSDFTGDGRADLLAVGLDGSLRAYSSTGTGLHLIGVVGSGWQAISQVAVPGDLTGDGLDDVMALTQANELKVYVGRAGGTLGPVVDTGASGAGVTRIL